MKEMALSDAPTTWKNCIIFLLFALLARDVGWHPAVVLLLSFLCFMSGVGYLIAVIGAKKIFVIDRLFMLENQRRRDIEEIRELHNRVHDLSQRVDSAI